MAFTHFILGSQFHGHVSWLVWEVTLRVLPLSTRQICRLIFEIYSTYYTKYNMRVTYYLELHNAISS